MVDFSISITAVQEIFCEDTTFVGLEHSSGVHRDGNGLLEEQLPEFLIASPIMFNIPDVFHMSS